VQIINRDSGKYNFSVSCYMLELYQDSLMDMLLPPPPKSARQGPNTWEPTRLEINKDPKGLVTVTGATKVQVCVTKQL
jgi:hypothetical protein